MINIVRTLDLVYRPIIDDDLKKTVYDTVEQAVSNFPGFRAGDTISVNYRINNNGLMDPSDKRCVEVYKNIAEVGKSYGGEYFVKDLDLVTTLFADLIILIFPRLIEHGHDYLLTVSIKTWEKQ